MWGHRSRTTFPLLERSQQTCAFGAGRRRRLSLAELRPRGTGSVRVMRIVVRRVVVVRILDRDTVEDKPEDLASTLPDRIDGELRKPERSHADPVHKDQTVTVSGQRGGIIHSYHRR